MLLITTFFSLLISIYVVLYGRTFNIFEKLIFLFPWRVIYCIELAFELQPINNVIDNGAQIQQIVKCDILDIFEEVPVLNVSFRYEASNFQDFKGILFWYSADQNQNQLQHNVFLADHFKSYFVDGCVDEFNGVP